MGTLTRTFGLKTITSLIRAKGLRIGFVIPMTLALLLGTTLTPISSVAYALPTTHRATTPAMTPATAAPSRVKSATIPAPSAAMREALNVPRRLSATYTTSGAVLAGGRVRFTVGGIEIGRGVKLTTPATTLVHRANATSYASRTTTDSFAPVSAGIEQTVTVRARPAGSGALTIQVPISGDLLAAGSGTSIDLKANPHTIVATYSHLKVVDARGQTVPATLSTVDQGRAIAITVHDARATYPLTIDPTWAQVAEFVQYQDFGGQLQYAATPTGTILLPVSNAGSNAIDAYSVENGAWVDTQTISPVNIDITSSYAATSNELVTTYTAAGVTTTYVYTLVGATWTLGQSFTESGASPTVTLSPDGNTLAEAYIGNSVGTATSAGQALIFTRTAGSFALSTTLSAPDACTNCLFGASMTLAGSELAISAEGSGFGATTGTVYVYSGSGASWTMTGELYGTTSEANFGRNIAISGNLLAIADNNINWATGTGTQNFVYTYEWNGTTWQFLTRLSTGITGTGTTAFGSSVAFTTNYDGYPELAIGDPGASGQVGWQGVVNFFYFNGTTWVGESQLFPADAHTNGYFGEWMTYTDGLLFVVSFSNISYGSFYPLNIYLYDSSGALATSSTIGRSTAMGSKTLKPCNKNKNPVNCSSGDFWHTFTDSSIPGYGPSLNLTRTYNSLNASTEGIFGYGWSSSYDQHLVVNGDSSISITMADGSQLTAEPNGSGGFTLPTSSDSTLTMSGSNYLYNWQGTVTYEFNSSGQLTSITDPNGFSTLLGYSSGKLSTVTDSSSRTLTFAYGTNGLVSSVTDPLSRVTHYSYDSSGNLTSVTDPLGKVTSFTYGTNHLLLTMTFPNGQSGGSHVGTDVVNTYNSSGQVLTQTDQLGNITTFAYTGNNFSLTGGTTTITDPNGNVEVQDYLNGILQSLTKGYGTSSAATWTYNYDPITLGTASTTDPNGNTTSATYDASGNLISKTNALGKTTTFTYNSFGEQTCMAQPLAANPCSSLTPPSAITAGTATIVPPSSAPPAYVTYSEYDTDGKLIYQTTGDYTPSGTLTQVRTSYRLYNGQSVTLGTTNDSCTTSAPSTELPCATINPDGVVTQLTYDSRGDLTSKSTTYPSKTTYGYDTDGEQTSMTTPDGNLTGANAANFTTTYVYNSGGQLTSETQGGGTGSTVTARTTSYGYDGDGNTTSVTDARGYATTTAFNANDEPTLVTNPLGNATLTCYDGVGNVSEVVPPVGVAANSLTPASCPSSFPSGYGNRLATDATSSTYNALSEKTVVTTPAPPGLTGFETTTNGYDLGGRLTSVTAPSTSTSGGASISAVGSLAQFEGAGISTLSVNPQHAGDSFVLAVQLNTSGVSVTGVSGGGATWHKLTNAGSNPVAELWLGTVAATGASTITVTYSGSVTSTYIDLEAQEYTNGAGSTTTWSQDVVGSSNNPSSTVVNFPTFTPSAARELYAGFAVVSQTGLAGTTSGFTYDVTSPAPSVSSVSPNTGSTAGGTSLTVTGTNFTGATAVKFGSVAATSFSVTSSTTATAVSPAGTAGTVDVTVTTPNGTSATNSSDTFTYGTPAPTVTNVSPSSGSTAGGTSATVTGTNFTGATAVKFGSVAATSFSVTSSTTATAVSPAGTAGTVDVTVTTPNGTSATNSGDTFAFVTSLGANVFIYNPNVSNAVSPTAAQSPAGTSITVGALIVASGGATNDVTDYTYDAAGNLLTTTVGVGTTSAATTSYCYDPDENRTAVVAADGNVTTVATCSTSSPYQTSSSYQTGYKYDSLGELVTQVAPVTTAAPSGQITTYTYDPAGNQITSTNPNAVTATNTYTPLNQLASVTYSDDTHGVLYSYDANGNMTGMVDASGTTTNGYDPFNEMTSSTNGAGAATAYSYDVDGNTTGITYPLGSGATWASTNTVAYTYDHADQMASVTDFNGHTSNYTTTADGLPSALTLGASGDTVSTSYAANGAPSSITLGNGSTLQQFSYSDAPSGAIASETDLPSSSLSPAAYAYNAQSQVTQDTPGSGPAKSYALDASGNLTTLPTGASGTYNAASQVTSSTLSGTATSYTYDAAGNRTGESVGGTAAVAATYNGVNELTTYSDSAASMSSSTYNGLGLRTTSTITPSGGGAATQNFTWDDATGSPLLLMDSTNAYIYGIGGTPLEQLGISSGTIRYFDSDVLGSVRGIVSSSGSLSASTSYDAWGNPQTSGGLLSYSPFGFTGGYTDGTQLIYLVNRFLDTSVGQFVSVDPMNAFTGQPYSYTADNPINVVDPLGLFPNWSSIRHGISSGFDVTRHTFAAATDYPANLLINGGYSIYSAYDQIYQNGQNGCSFFSSSNLNAVEAALIADINVGSVADGGESASALEAAVNSIDAVAIKGFTKHGLEQILGRDGGVGVSNAAVSDAVTNPLEVTPQLDGKLKYVGSDAVVILNSEGKVVTAWATGKKGVR